MVAVESRRFRFARFRSAAVVVAACVSCLWLVAAPLAADVPQTINYQGRLLQNTADQDAVGGTVDIVFSLWDDETGGSRVWSETWNDVEIDDGIFSVLLGSNGSPLMPEDFFGAAGDDVPLYLQLEVDGETLTPRQVLGSAPFAFTDDPDNELQDLRLVEDELRLSRSDEAVDLSPYLDDTDEQDLSLDGNDLTLENDPTPVDLSPYLDNTDAQTLTLEGDTLTISGSGSSVDLGEAVEFSSLSDRVTAVEEALTRRVFVTSQAWAGTAIGGLAGGDAKCQALADGAGLDGLFRAWLSDSTGSAAGRIDRLGRFELVTGAKVADTWADLTDGTIDKAIGVDESGATAAGVATVWTGTETDGSAAVDHCLDWSLDGAEGRVGGRTATDASWTAASTATCSDTGRLYCFEQVAIGVDDQQLTLVGDELRLTSDDGTDTIDLSAYLDDSTVDNQVLSLSGNQLQLTSDDGTDTVSLVSFLDNTDNQSLSLSGNQLQLTSDDGTDTIDLSAYLDNTDTQDLSLSGNTLSLTNGGSVGLSKYLDNTDSQDINSVLANGGDANNRDLTNLDDVDIDKLTIDDDFECDADTADCIRSEHIEKDTILGNDITDRIFIVYIDCNGSCSDMSMREACDSIEDLRGLDFEVELMGVSCTYDVPSTTGNQFVDCPVPTDDDNECRAFELRTLGDLPCINGDGTDVIVTCYATDIAK